MALSLTLLAGVVLYVATDRGAIVINSPDANIQIEIRRHGEDGGEIYRLDAGKNRFSFRSDKYEVVVKGADADQYRIENGDIRLSRGDEELVSIKRLPANSEATAASKTEAFTSEQQAFFDHVASLPGEKQVEAVKQKLMEFNPGFDGKLTSKIENDHVVELQLVTDHVTQIWPVRALADLRELSCEGSDIGKGRLEDLSPLQGLSLTSLECGKTRVSDLTPLKNMPLARLGCNGTNVTDLSPLTAAPLVDLSFGNTRVSDLSPLKGMSLKHLVCGGTLVTDLSPLKGKRIGWLTVSGIPVRDLSPIQGMPLRWLVCQNMAVSDLAPLKSATQIKKLGIAGLKIIGSDSPLDLSWLKELPVEELSVSEDAAMKKAPVLKELKTLKTINDMPAADFWKTHHGSSARTFDLTLPDKQRPFVILDRNGKVRTEVAHPVPARWPSSTGRQLKFMATARFGLRKAWILAKNTSRFERPRDIFPELSNSKSK